jgi:hypothetical protein
MCFVYFNLFILTLGFGAFGAVGFLDPTQQPEFKLPKRSQTARVGGTEMSYVKYIYEIASHDSEEASSSAEIQINPQRLWDMLLERGVLPGPGWEPSEERKAEVTAFYRKYSQELDTIPLSKALVAYKKLCEVRLRLFEGLYSSMPPSSDWDSWLQSTEPDQLFKITATISSPDKLDFQLSYRRARSLARRLIESEIPWGISYSIRDAASFLDYLDGFKNPSLRFAKVRLRRLFRQMLFHFSDHLPNQVKLQAEYNRLQQELDAVRPDPPNPALTQQILCSVFLEEAGENEEESFPRISDPK